MTSTPSWAIAPAILGFYIVRREGDDWIIKYPESLAGRPTMRRSGDDGADSVWQFMENGDCVLLEHRKSRLICNADGTLTEEPMTDDAMAQAFKECE